MNEVRSVPADAGYVFPPEFAPHEATWLSWPHNPETWPGKIDTIYPAYAQFVRVLARSEEVRINVRDMEMEGRAAEILGSADVDLSRVRFFHHPTNDAWCRDHGPAFVVNPALEHPKAVVDWGYNAWGGKYPPYDLDDVIPTLIAERFALPVYHPGIVMEGGSVEFNGIGDVLTSTSCLLNPNRNPHLTRDEIERYLCDYYGVRSVLWVDDGIEGDDTDGHIDDTIRFVSHDTVLCVVETRRSDANFEPLARNRAMLSRMRLGNGTPLTVVDLPMPDPVIWERQRLPASYANFYICNTSVIVPTFRCAADDKALDIIASCFPGREVVGIDSVDLIWGLGSFHCLSQQEPLVLPSAPAE